MGCAQGNTVDIVSGHWSPHYETLLSLLVTPHKTHPTGMLSIQDIMLSVYLSLHYMSIVTITHLKLGLVQLDTDCHMS